MRIIELRAQNVMGLQACDLTPEPHLNIVGGKNGAGKSSLLNCIVAALAGKGGMPAEPLKRGATKGEVLVRIDRPDGELIVRRKIGDSGKTSLVVESADGARYSKPQQLLDELVGAVGFDPHQFCRLSPARQAEQLRDLVGLDLSDLEGERQRVYDKRAEVNREVKRLEGVAATNPVDADLPDQEISISGLMQELEAAQQHNRSVGVAGSAVRQTEQRIGELAREVKAAQQEVDRLKRQLKEAEAEMSSLEARRQQAESELEEQQATFSAMEEIDCGPIMERVNSAEQTNAAIRANRTARETGRQLMDCRASAEQLTGRIAEIDQQKRERLAAAPWPVDGLGFDDGRVTFRGLPFQQASSAEQLRVSLAMGMACNPKLRVLIIRDGSLIDQETMAVIRDQVEANDFQLWIERVSSTGEGCSIVVTEGVAEAIGGES